MELKTIFQMTKTDRYTQDGRDELAKLQETEDVRYKTGDISQKTGLQKQPDGSWAPPKTGAGSKENWMERNTKKQAKEILAKAGPGRTFELKMGENGQPTLGKEVKTYGTKKEAHEALNKQKAEIKPAAERNLGNYPGWKPNKVEKVDNSNRPYRIEGTQFYFETPEEAQTAIVAGTRGEGKTYAKPSSDATINEIQNALGFKLDSEYAGKYSMDDFIKKTGKDEYGVRVWSFGTDSKGTLIDTIVEGYNKPDATIKKENGEWRLHYTDRDGKKMIVTPKGREWPTSDSTPRELTGDTKIRIRK